jgi:uncharacterized protein (DUF2062 family)
MNTPRVFKRSIAAGAAIGVIVVMLPFMYVVAQLNAF